MACREVEMGKVLCVMWGCVCACGDVCVHVGKGRARGACLHVCFNAVTRQGIYIYICDQTYAYSIVLFFFLFLNVIH